MTANDNPQHSRARYLRTLHTWVGPVMRWTVRGADNSNLPQVSPSYPLLAKARGLTPSSARHQFPDHLHNPAYTGEIA